MTIKTRYIILTLIFAFTAIFLLGRSCGRSRAESRSESIISGLNGKITSYEYQIAELTKYASEKDQMILSQKQAISSHLIEKAEFKNLYFKSLNEVTLLKSQIRILSDSIEHTGEVITVPSADTLAIEFPAIRLPFAFKEETKYYSLKGGFSYEGNMNIDLNVPVELSLWTGIDKKTKEYKAVVTTDNPVVKIQDITSMKFDMPKPKRFSIGIQAGYGIGKDGLTPYIGFGGEFVLLSF